MKAIVLYLELNFENKLSEVHNLEPKYLSPEQEAINKIISSQCYCTHTSSVSLGFVANPAGAHIEPVMIIALGLVSLV